MNNVTISERLKLVAGLVPKGSRLADIGTDHGYVPIYLVLRNQIGEAIAMDVRKGPLERAGEHIQQYGLQDKIATRLSDGLQELKPGEADAVVIAGMGGELIMKILSEGRHVWDSVKTWILSPQSDLSKVRHYLEEQGFSIQEEHMLFEDGKYYTVMVVVRDKMHYQREIDYIYGHFLLEEKNPVLKSYLEKEERTMKGILQHLKEQAESTDVLSRQKELEHELCLNQEAWHEMQ